MRTTRRHATARLAIAAGVVAGVASVGSPADAAAVFFQGQTTATAVHFRLTQEPASSIITASLVDDAAAYAASNLDTTGGSDAQAAAVYPGNLVVQGPSLLCSQIFSCPTQPPPYPLLAEASYPRSTDANAPANQNPEGTGPFLVTPAQSTAHASAGANSAQTSAGDVQLLAGSPAATTVGLSKAMSKLTTSGSTLTVHIESSATDVTIGTLVHIDAVRAVDDISLHQGLHPVDHPKVTVLGATVAGVPASIDSTGIHVAGHDGPSLGRALRQQGISLRTVGVDRADTATAARSTATGLQVDIRLPVSGVPYVPNPLPPPFDQVPGVNANGTYLASITLGAVGAVGGLQTEPVFGLGDVTPTRAGVSATTATGASISGVDQSSRVVTTPGQLAPQVAGQQTWLTGFLDDLSKHAGELVYAVLALGTVGLFLGWRGSVLLGAGRPGPAVSRRRR